MGRLERDCHVAGTTAGHEWGMLLVLNSEHLPPVVCGVGLARPWLTPRFDADYLPNSGEYGFS